MTPKELAEIWRALPDNTDANDFPHRAEMIYNKDLLPRYIEACYYSVALSDSTERAATFMVEQAHGLRRLETREGIESAAKLLDTAQANIYNIDDKARVKRLIELVLYHSIWGVHFPLGDFGKCADLCENSVTYATDKLSQARAGYHHLLFLLWEAIVIQASNHELEELAIEVNVAGQHLIDVAKGTDAEYHETANVLCHELTLVSINPDISLGGSELYSYEETAKLQSWILNGKISLDGFGATVAALSAKAHIELGDDLAGQEFLKHIHGYVEAEAFAKLISLQLSANKNAEDLRPQLDDLLNFNDQVGGHLYRGIARLEFSRLLSAK